jgi:Ca2+-binding RTX toxin-like protein
VLTGGAGVDRMFGGAGNDTYYVANAGDVVNEATAGASGTDRVLSSISFILPYAPQASAAVENLTLGGTAAINGTGNAFANIITGNAGANSLSGFAGNDVLNGGAGADRMFGGAGNDTYFVDSGGDVVTEAIPGSNGTDRVMSSISFILPYAPQGGAVEHLTLLGTGAVNGTGNVLANVITGNASNNILNGLGGNDTLTGGAGNDAFLFNSALNATTNVDRVTDFFGRADSIRLDNAVFTQLPATYATSSSRWMPITSISAPQLPVRTTTSSTIRPREPSPTMPTGTVPAPPSGSRSWPASRR